MKTTYPSLRYNRLLLALVGVFGFVVTAQTAPTDISNEPLGNPISSTKPNIMFILDDSGSMGWDFSPDYMGDDETDESSPNVCFDHKDDDDKITSWITTTNVSAENAKLKQCRLGDVPYMSPQFNKQYYNPTIYYRPAVNYDNSEMLTQNAANTSDWTLVRTDMFNQANKDQLDNAINHTNLATGYPDRVWCTTKADNKNNTALCKTNQDYTYPNDRFGYGKDSSGNIKYVFGAPYYYLAAATEYCTTSNLTTCNAQAAPNTTYPYPAISRWCTNSGFSSATTTPACLSKRVDTKTYGRAFGRVHNTSGPTPAISSYATITVTAGPSSLAGISSIKINGVSVLSASASYGPINGVTLSGGNIVASSGTDSSDEQNSVAAAIQRGLNGVTDGTYTYTATNSGNTVFLAATPAGSGPNGRGIIVTPTNVSTTAAKYNLKVTKVVLSSSITALKVDSINIIGGAVSCNYADTATNRNSCATAIAAAINSYASSPEYTATATTDTVTITAPLSLGSSANGWSVQKTGTVTTSTGNMNGGVTNSPLTTTAISFSGGEEVTTAVAPRRTMVFPFTRVNIISGQNYPKANDRSDCITTAGLCTYAEEMTNFANWYTYYRTRMQMMKSAAGHAFIPVSDKYRVGFITINPGSTISASKYLKIDDFTDGESGQRDKWYTKFYGQAINGSTPLREALSRVGWIFGGKFGTGLTTGLTAATDDPVLYSCQPNFAILSSDGYWNGNAGKKLDGSAVGNQDGVNSGYSKRIDGALDANNASNTLSDVALYYYKTDLRTAMTDNVPQSGRDKAQHQHMTTFTLGLGLDGYLNYLPNYDDPSLTTGDFYAIKQGTLNWPTPVAETPSALDDLWHAAVNGRGKFFSASNPADLAKGLSETLATLKQSVGAGAAAATSNLQPVAGDNFAFTAQYETVKWVGDLKAKTIDLSTGTVSNVPLWSAQEKLDNTLFTSRKIYLLDSADTTGNQLRNFCWTAGDLVPGCTDGAGLTPTEQAYFNPNTLVQYSGWTALQKAAATGLNLVNYLRGDKSLETTSAGLDTDLYRNRAHILGDIAAAQPAYVKASSFNYTDTGYTAFKTCTSGLPTGSSITCPSTFPLSPNARRATVYAGANDGMLHAFETDVNTNPYYQTGGISTVITTDDTFTGNNNGNGVERWAYMPSAVLPNLKKLAEDPYTHRFFVDGSPTAGDVCTSSPCVGLNDWRTILVGGLNSGGRGYYALDITNPDVPKGLWEFSSGAVCLTDAQANEGTFSSDCHLGYTYGNPLITKIKPDNKWVVIVTSGYNNYNPGDGKGYLYVLDAITGKILRRMTTGVGDNGTSPSFIESPSGLAKINAWVDNSLANNTTLAVYGGDLLGNLWKFSLDPDSAPWTVTKLAQVTDASSNPQPITVKPEIGGVGTKRIVLFGTGKFLGDDDKTDTRGQSVYAIGDDGVSTTIVRSDLVLQTMEVTTAATRGVTTTNAVDWTTGKGWYVDLPDSGERVNVDPQLQLGTLVVASNVPSSDSCTAGGYSWLNYFDYKTGRFVLNTPATKLASSLIVGMNVVVLPGGKVVAIVTTGDNQQPTVEPPIPPSSFQGRRVLWRELVDEQ